jgi:hypothetical protein
VERDADIVGRNLKSLDARNAGIVAGNYHVVLRGIRDFQDAGVPGSSWRN